MAESTDKKTVAERAEALSEEVLESVRDRQQSVIEGMRKFVDRLDDAMPDLGDPERRKKVLDAIVDFAEQLATTTNDFVGRMVRSASGTLKQRAAKPAAEAPAKPAAKAVPKPAAEAAPKPAAD
ncbi:hypothetical protein [Mycobacterium sp.]|uniref:hypothetical protein n=1 Tax=Mycobacterium sp. TaxID=1785 RepID=UPI003C75CE96